VTLFTAEEATFPSGPPVPPRRRRVGAVVASIVVLIAAGGAAIWALSNWQRIDDQFTVWKFIPTATLQEYVDRSTMSGEGEFLFYASVPTVHEDGDFDTVCSNRKEDVGILGCYLPSTKSIHLYDVTDERLDGIKEVIASHEMLHAAWDRMRPDEQAAVGALLEKEFEALAGDTDLAARMEFYAETEPGERLNELHSIIGTEIADLSPELEAHYATYFTDRGALVALHVTSDAVFTDLQARAEALVTSLDALRAGVEADFATYNAGYDSLNADIDSFNARADAGGFASQREFAAERAALIARQDSLDALFATIEQREAQYETGVNELNSLNAQVVELNSSINITPRDGGGL
jgi:hypothetical protein